MAHIILTGATGTAGSAILAHCLAWPAIIRISILSRRPVALAQNHLKAQVLICENFESFSQSTLAQLKGATACIWAQGISSRGMGEEEYAKITVDYPVAAARAFADLAGEAKGDEGAKMNFVYLSSEGASTSEDSYAMFGRIKGRAENTLISLSSELQNLRVFCVRPALINPEGNYLAERKIGWLARFSSGMGSLLERSWKAGVISTEALARVCVDLALSDGEAVPVGDGVDMEGRVLRNTALRRLAGL